MAWTVTWVAVLLGGMEAGALVQLVDTTDPMASGSIAAARPSRCWRGCSWAFPVAALAREQPHGRVATQPPAAHLPRLADDVAPAWRSMSLSSRALLVVLLAIGLLLVVPAVLVGPSGEGAWLFAAARSRRWHPRPCSQATSCATSQSRPGCRPGLPARASIAGSRSSASKNAVRAPSVHTHRPTDTPYRGDVAGPRGGPDGACDVRARVGDIHPRRGCLVVAAAGAGLHLGTPRPCRGLEYEHGPGLSRWLLVLVLAMWAASLRLLGTTQR
jgi:hypothetical protein